MSNENIESKFYVLITKKAGNYQERITEDISGIFLKHGLQVNFEYFTDVEGVIAKIRKAYQEGYYSYLAVGGDGTTSLLASCLSGRPHRLGIIPAGTTHTLARILGIPLKVGKAIEAAASSTKLKSIDGLKVGTRTYFLNVSSGVSSITLEGVKARRKSSFGVMAYAFGITRKLKDIRSRKYTLKIDNSEYQIVAAEIHVTNTGMIATPDYRVYKDSRMDDGRAEILSLCDWSGKEIMGAVLDVFIRKKNRNIHLLAAGKEIDISCEESVEVQADGDVLGKTPVHVQVIHRANNFIVP